MNKKMKKLFAFIILVSTTAVAHAQSNYDILNDGGFARDLAQILAIIAVIFMLTTFIISLIKLYLDHRIRNKVIDKGVDESVVSQLLQPEKRSAGDAAIKWFIIFAGIGVGLTLINMFRPFGIHSLAIMSFSIAAGFLGYYFFTKRNANQ